MKIDRNFPFSWAKSEMENEEFKFWATDYLRKRKFALDSRVFYNLPSINLEDENTFIIYHVVIQNQFGQDFLASTLKISNIAMKDIGNDMKNAWNVKKSRKKNGVLVKKNRSYSLSPKAVSIIDKMAKHWCTSKSEATERIVIEFDTQLRAIIKEYQEKNTKRRRRPVTNNPEQARSNTNGSAVSISNGYNPVTHKTDLNK
jgi:hypothetical protein